MTLSYRYELKVTRYLYNPAAHVRLISLMHDRDDSLEKQRSNVRVRT